MASPTDDTPTTPPLDDQPATKSDAKPGHRIAKLLARAGVASRREVERMIADGRVSLDGAVLDTPATILRNLAGVTVDGVPVAPAEATRLFLYHKPTGLLVTEYDPAGRPTIYDRLPEELPRVVPVGRLDLNTEGLLLLTTDGELKRQLELPATGVERAYRARTYGQVSQAQLEDLADGIEIDGMRYGSIDANMERRTGANAWVEMILTEGKNREVRRVLEHLELQVSRLIRTRYGPFVLGDLAPGQVGEVKQHDLVNFRKWLDSPKRGHGRDEPAVTVEARKAAASRPAPRPASARPEPARPTAEPQGRLRIARPVTPRPAPRPPRDDDPSDTPARADRYRDDRGRSDRGPNDRGRSDQGQGDRDRSDRGRNDRGRSDRARNDPGRSDRSAEDRGRPARPTGDRPRDAKTFGNDRPRTATDRPRAPLGVKQTPRSAAGRPDAAPRPSGTTTRPTKGPADGRGRPARNPAKGPADGRGRPPRGKR